MSEFIKQAEEMAIARAKEMSDMLEVLDALNMAGGRMFQIPEQIKDFSDGMQLIRKSFYAKYLNAISDCFLMVGVGGEKAAEYSREKFEELFSGNRYTIMNFLDKYGNIPTSYKTKDEKEFRDEAKELLK